MALSKRIEALVLVTRCRPVRGSGPGRLSFGSYDTRRGRYVTMSTFCPGRSLAMTSPAASRSRGAGPRRDGPGVNDRPLAVDGCVGPSDRTGPGQASRRLRVWRFPDMVRQRRTMPPRQARHLIGGSLSTDRRPLSGSNLQSVRAFRDQFAADLLAFRPAALSRSITSRHPALSFARC